MMRTLLFCMLLAAVGLARADDLDTANKAFEAKDYPKALMLYNRLADGGNPEAQLRLGEMYWYGEGVALDRSKGDALFAKAAAAGNKEAAADLGLTAQRAQKAADIVYWTGGYTGADLTSGKFACQLPVLPSTTSSDQEILKLNKDMKAWRECYTGFVSNIGDSMPAGKRIPPDVAIVMSEAELQQAKVHLDKVYTAVLNKARTDSTASAAELDKWRTVVEKSVEARNASTREHNLRMQEQQNQRAINAGSNASVGGAGR